MTEQTDKTRHPLKGGVVLSWTVGQVSKTSVLSSGKRFLRFLLTGQRETELSTLDIYRRILSHEDGYTRRHRLTQQGVPRKARQWPVRARRYHATIHLVRNDERRTA